MQQSEKDNTQLSQSDLEDLVIESDAGARNPTSAIAAKILLGTALLWSLFQLAIASPQYYDLVSWINSFDLSFFTLEILGSDKSRRIHLALAVFLSFLAYPAFKKSPRKYIPTIDWLLALAAAYCALYYYFHYEEIIARLGAPTDLDIWVSSIGVLLLLEATRRALGPPLVIIAAILLLYTYFGNSEFLPDLIRHKGQPLSKMASHMWLTGEGVFGIALGVSTDFVFLFVLFGALLDKAGAGNFFIKLAFSLLGHLRGGPAKAAVLSSGMTGLISGSSIANVVTTGTFTIPLMRRVGFSGAKAGAVEVASSVNGQIMPPVMGAAAFLMVEYVNIPYEEVVKHAFLPAIISYIALLYMVHLEAVKSNMAAIPKEVNRTMKQSFIVYGIFATSMIIVAGIAYYLISWMKPLLGDNAPYIFSLILFVSYILLIRYSCTVPELEIDAPDAKTIKLPETGLTLKAGLHYLLPIVVLVWFLMIERKSPGLSAFYATLVMIFIMLTQKYFKAIFRKTGKHKEAIREGFDNLLEGLIVGARNMIGIGVATAAAGIIVGVVSLTGIGGVLSEVIEVVSGGSLFLILLLTAVICLILGMGLPTTANYIVVASLMAHVVQQLATKNGLDVPLIAIHMFVFYFGIMADVSPPVGLASFAAAAISGADPIKTGLQAFLYSLRTAILPFFFIFNTELIMVGVETIWHGGFVFFYATIAILVFSAATQGYFIVKCKIHETLMLLLVSVMIFVPSLFNNILFSPFGDVAIADIENESSFAEKSRLRISGRGENDLGDMTNFSTYIDIKDEKNINDVLTEYGLLIAVDSEHIKVNGVKFGSKAQIDGVDFSYVVTKIEQSLEQPSKRYMYIPAIILLIFVIISQLARRRRNLAVCNIDSNTVTT